MREADDGEDARSEGSDPGPGQSMTGLALDQFLNEGIVARLACLDSEGWPYNVPVWHEWDGAAFWVIAAEGAAWATYLRADPRVALCIDDPPTLSRVLCQGRAVLVEEATDQGRWNAIARNMAARYLGEDAVAGYETSSAGVRRILFRIEPRRFVTWRGPGRSEHRPSKQA